MCKLHGVRLIKGIKIFESMFNQNLPSFLAKNLSVTSTNLVQYFDSKSYYCAVLRY